MSSSPRPQADSSGSRRVDARANRSRILDVAEEVFGRAGESASTEEVARRAEVGIATVFRHFPTKAALLQAVLVRRFDRLREQAQSLVEAADPGAAFFGFFRHLVEDAASKIAIGEALLAAGGDVDGEAAQASAGLRQAVGGLLQRAQEAGAVRGDVALPEVYALLVSTSRTASHAHLDADAMGRVLRVIFDGLAFDAAPDTSAPDGPRQVSGKAPL